jgi:hypothetical protein
MRVVERSTPFDDVASSISKNIEHTELTVAIWAIHAAAVFSKLVLVLMEPSCVSVGIQILLPDDPEHHLGSYELRNQTGHLKVETDVLPFLIYPRLHGIRRSIFTIE